MSYNSLNAKKFTEPIRFPTYITIVQAVTNKFYFTHDYIYVQNRYKYLVLKVTSGNISILGAILGTKY